jgi:hypothetical protein
MKHGRHAHMEANKQPNNQKQNGIPNSAVLSVHSPVGTCSTGAAPCGGAGSGRSLFLSFFGMAENKLLLGKGGVKKTNLKMREKR